MTDVVFITGNQNKADYLSKYLGYEVEHQKVDLDEIQSLDLNEIVNHKVRQAYELVGRPVLVEDVSMEIDYLGGLPGPFIKWFLENMEEQRLCDLVPARENRTARVRCVFGYYDGNGSPTFFEGVLEGELAKKPAGDGGYGFDRMFAPSGYDGQTRAELNEQEDKDTYTTMKPFAKVKEYLENL